MKYIFVQNTLTPYRISLFNKLYDQGLDFSVLYMCRQESDRSWTIDESTIRFPYSIEPGFYKYWHSFHFHWNFSLIRKICKSSSTIILGGSWNDLNIMFLSLLKRLGFVKSDFIFWTEANYLTIGASKKNTLRDLLRSFVYKSGTKNFIVPGEMAEKTLHLWNVEIYKTFKLPNVIEEEKFTNIRHSFSELNELPVFTCPARLIEELKGIKNFFESIGVNNIKRAMFYILGDGPDEKLYKDYIQSIGMENHIKLVGFCNMSQVVEYYEKTDVFLLPSFSDPSPLSIVEALSCGIPLMVSERCGNHFEAIREGENGFTFNPYDKNDVRTCFETMLAKRTTWKEMGEKSLSLFERNFKQSNILPHFIEDLNKF